VRIAISIQRFAADRAIAAISGSEQHEPRAAGRADDFSGGASSGSTLG
jgi:hypothetical protein